MAKFSAQEVSALQEGGNQRAKEIFFKEWDPQSNSLPDSSNVDRLRDFIKHVYVDRRFTGERSYDKPPRGDKDDSYENRRLETYQGGPKSPPYEDTYERRYSDRSSPGGRSPGYDQERNYADHKRSPGRPTIINDWRREDRFGGGQKFEDRRISDGGNKMESQSPERAKDLDSSSPPPVVRPVREILGENVVPLRISEPPKANSGQAANGPALTQRTASSSSLASSNGTPAEVKLETIRSLIDFDDNPEPPIAPAIPQATQTTAAQLVNPTNSGDNNWASFDVAPEVKVSQGHSNVNSLDSMLSQLSVPSSSHAQVSGAQGPLAGSAINATAGGAPTVSSFATFPASVASLTSGLTTASPFNNTGSWSSLQYQQPQPLFTSTVGQPTIQQSTLPVGGALTNQPWITSSVPTIQGHPVTHVSKVVDEEKSSVASQNSTVNIKPSGRNELPEDLFAVNYSSFPAPVPGWQMGAPPGMGVSVHYNNVMSVPSFPQPSQSTNPFDVINETTSVQAPTFPSMVSLQGALPGVTPSATVHPSNMGNQSFAWNPPSSLSYAPMPPPQAQTLASATGPRAFMEQQMPNNMPLPRHQGGGTFGTEGTAFGFSNIDQQLNGRLPASATLNPFPTGGNPFG
ncbi:putative ADP-ribosylation factor GTPase-activating protein [Trifolium pratense]|uniref:Putative ADP-ribosylation factor GTPase-activating protein n=1 Tax=Trifolium pratense TaxID=57577 RepID=A0A2K3NM73_TRIPR|nr:putative ADP-ribosylation factor GTPase-activating protein [Trifolium pratense]